MGSKKTQFYIIAAFSLIVVNSQSIFSCPPGYISDWTGRCVPSGSTPCPPGQRQDRISGQCINVAPRGCPSGQMRDPVSGQCVNVGPNPGCPSGQRLDTVSGKCINIDPGTACQFRDPVTGACIDPNSLCPPGLNRDPYSDRCVATNQQQCPFGKFVDLFTGQCTTSQNWLCNVCNECCYNQNYVQQLSTCNFDYQGTFEGCLANYGFAPQTINTLISVRSNPIFQTVLKSFRTRFSYLG